MATIKKFEDIEAWQLARKHSLSIFELTSKNPFCSDFKFRDQIRSAARSVMDNIAEGFERSSRLEFIHFLGIAKGSCGEVKSQLYGALDQKYISEEMHHSLYLYYDILSAKIASFISYLNKTEIKGQRFLDRV
jgi:four helix bundle protein